MPIKNKSPFLSTGLSRRALLRYSVLGGASLAVGELATSVVRATTAKAAGSEPVVDTAAGRVRGYFANGVNTFKGIPYGASTAGASRFMAPRKPLPWTGARDATRLGPQAPQMTMEAMQRKMSEAQQKSMETFKLMFAGVWEPATSLGEDCLVLNVWTPALDNAKRPVMVWLHGGGLAGGSGGAPWYDGGHLAHDNDVVTITINHRLNVLGYLYLGEWGGEKYADSGNAGMLDIVAALQWVRDNIAAFGGDAGNVTIFGQSGGGWKVNSLMTMPAAKGLFHKAIVQSGPLLRGWSRAEAVQAAESFLKTVGLKPNQVDELQKMPAGQLIDAVSTDLMMKLRPLVDGRNLPAHPFDPSAPAISATVPLLIGTMQEDAQELTEAALAIDEAALLGKLQEMLDGDAKTAKRLIASYRQRRADASPGELLTAIVTDHGMRMNSIIEAERKLDQKAAAVYMYLFAWRSPFMGARFKTPHNTELSFVFDNLDKAPGLVGSHPNAQALALARNTSRAWAAFARTGNPNHDGLPQWKPYDLKDRETMVFDESCQLVSDPQREDRLIMEPLLRHA